MATIIAALIGAAIGAFFAPIALDWWFKPKLRIERVDPRQQAGVRFIRVTVRNKGRRGAKNCIGLIKLKGITPEDVVDWPATITFPLVGKPEVDQHSILQRSSFEQGNPLLELTSLCWAIGEPTITLNPKTPAALDILRIIRPENRRNEWVIDIASEHQWKPVRARIRARTEGHYEGELWVTAQNTGPAHRRFEVHLSPEDVDLKLL